MNRFAFLALLLCVGCVPVRVNGGKTGKAPFASPDGLRVLIVEESGDRNDLSPSQREIITATADGSVRAWSKANAVECLVLDKDDGTEKLSKPMQEAFAVPRSGVPYILAAYGKRGFKGEIKRETKPAEVLAALQKVKGK